MEVMDDIHVRRILSGLFYGCFTLLSRHSRRRVGRNRPYYMPSDWYAAIGRKEVIYAAELAVPRARSARRHTAVV